MVGTLAVGGHGASKVRGGRQRDVVLDRIVDRSPMKCSHALTEIARLVGVDIELIAARITERWTHAVPQECVA